ncbi:hypothetical protein HER32_11185 [Hymenobacter sp. BT18]|uniref:BatA domain-containing protein n=1 Tax=Hymenobacter sp. BT18 TaxID=2835648 RepID=UPI00143E8C9A|nr:BatA domain-containing protein [Hymenobacter sp. BT18]QIX61710.1 hypothetical protein HER32_11185 [Hymenobacter sp. BT18]
MLSFSSPSGFIALLGLLVPLAIYLWNRRPGRTVRVGSLRWLETGANQRLRSLKPEQLPLFLLRALLLTLLALAVAGLRWQQPPPPVRGQLLISPELLASETLPAVRASLDSLRKRGYETRMLRAGFPLVAPAAWARLDSGLTVVAELPRQPENTWMRVQQAVDSFPNRPLRVFTSATRGQFQGRRPLLPPQVQWQLVPVADSSTWLQSAYQPRPDSLYLVLGRSTDEQVTFRPLRLAFPASGTLRVPGLGAWRRQPYQGGAYLLSATDTVLIRQRPIRAWLRADAAFGEDARFLRAALRAAAIGLTAPLQLTVSGQDPPAAMELDWLFWLSTAPLPRAQAVQTWQFPTDAGRAVTGRFQPFPDAPEISFTRVSRVSAASTQQVLWADGAARPLLTVEQQGHQQHYRCYTRLHASWSTLGNTPELPELLLPLLQQPSSVPLRYDRRLLPSSQISVVDSTPTTVRELPASAHYLDLRPWLAVAAAFLLGLERWLSSRQAATSQSSNAL